LATIAYLTVSSFLMIGGSGIQPVEVGSGPVYNHKGGVSTADDPNEPNAVSTDSSLTTEPTV
jgi:hypothetical protein